MQLDHQTAEIGCKLSDDRAKAPVRVIAEAKDYDSAMGLILQKTKNAKMKKYSLVLQNLMSVLDFSPRIPLITAFNQKPNQFTAGSKRKHSNDEDTSSDARLQMKNVQKLRDKYHCTEHNRCCSVVSTGPKTARHEELDDLKLGYWARSMVSICGTRRLPIYADEKLD